MDFPPAGAGAPSVDYEMDPQVISSEGDTVLDGLLSIPTVSIVMETLDMFGNRGLYSNTNSSGVSWERACSAELIYPSGEAGFGVNCGVRIQGGASRNPSKSPKHSVRLLFKGAYGPTKLEYPLFEGSPVESFDTVTFRANYNNSWIHWDSGQRGRGTLIRDQFARDSQLAMSGHLITRHLREPLPQRALLGVYNLVERPSAPFAASHLGGRKEEYDALNKGEAIDGNRDA